MFTGGEPVVKPPKCFAEVDFSFDDPRLAELQRLSEADDVVSAGKGYYDLAKLYDAGSGVEKCLEKVRWTPGHLRSRRGGARSPGGGTLATQHTQCTFTHATGQRTQPRPAPSKGHRAGGRVHTPSRPAGLPHPWGAISCTRNCTN